MTEDQIEEVDYEDVVISDELEKEIEELAEEAGISFDQMVIRLIEMGLDYHDMKDR